MDAIADVCIPNESSGGCPSNVAQKVNQKLAIPLAEGGRRGAYASYAALVPAHQAHQWSEFEQGYYLSQPMYMSAIVLDMMRVLIRITTAACATKLNAAWPSNRIHNKTEPTCGTRIFIIACA